MAKIVTSTGEPPRVLSLAEELDEEDKQRIAGRQWAQECIEEAKSRGGDFLVGFERHIKREYEEILASEEAMGYKEANKFEKEMITFGKYVGKYWGDIPTEYIVWLSDQGRKLRRYVKSVVFRERED